LTPCAHPDGDGSSDTAAVCGQASSCPSAIQPFVTLQQAEVDRLRAVIGIASGLATTEG
jgi:hypothetical protein